MATLIIDVEDPAGGRHARTVSIETCDADGRPVVAHGPTGTIVKRFERATNGAGHLEVDLTPSAALTPANTRYLVRVDSVSAGVIFKGPDTQTLPEALVGDFADLEAVAPGTIDGGDPGDEATSILDGGAL